MAERRVRWTVTVPVLGELLAISNDASEVLAMLRTLHALESWALCQGIRDGLHADVRTASEGAQLNAALLADDAWRARHTGLVRTYEKARAQQQVRVIERSPVLEAVNAALSSLGTEVSRALVAIETRAAGCTVEHGEASRAAVQTEANRYFVPFDQRVFDSGTRKLDFPKSLRLRHDQPDVAELRAAMSELSVLAEKRRAAQEVALLTMVVEAGESYNATRLIEEANYARELDAIGAVHPVTYRLDPTADWSTDAVLIPALIDAFSRTWDATIATAAVAHQAAPATNLVVAPGTNPARALAARIGSRGTAGPWQYRSMISQAVEELFGPGPSIGRTAAAEAQGAAGSPSAEHLAAEFALTAATIGLHVTAPPIGIALDVLVASASVLSEAITYDDKATDSRTTLNPAEALGRPPSVIAAAFQALGATAGAAPGRKALATALVAPVAAFAAEAAEGM